MKNVLQRMDELAQIHFNTGDGYFFDHPRVVFKKMPIMEFVKDLMNEVGEDFENPDKEDMDLYLTDFASMSGIAHCMDMQGNLIEPTLGDIYNRKYTEFYMLALDDNTYGSDQELRRGGDTAVEYSTLYQFTDNL